MKEMNRDRFVVGERVRFVNHVTGENLGLLEVCRMNKTCVFAIKFFGGTKELKFNQNGFAWWSSNLSIQKLKQRDSKTV